MPFWGLFAKKKCKNAISDPKNGCHFPRSRLFEIKFVDKVPLTPGNVTTKFRWNNQNRLGEKGINVIFFKNLKWLPFRGMLNNYAQISHCTPGPAKLCV